MADKKQKQKSFAFGTTLKAAGILFAITLVSGVALAVVNAYTEEPIQKQQKLKQEEAYREVLPEAGSFTELNLDILENEEDLRAVLDSGDTDLRGATVTSAVLGMDAENQKAVGAVINAVTEKGYGGDIEISVGFDANGVITGVAILDINETAGLGMNAKKEAFRSQYIGKAVDAFVVTKNGKQADNEIDAISSATITSKAVTDAVNAARIFMDYMITEEEVGL